MCCQDFTSSEEVPSSRSSALRLSGRVLYRRPLRFFFRDARSPLRFPPPEARAIHPEHPGEQRGDMKRVTSRVVLTAVAVLAGFEWTVGNVRAQDRHFEEIIRVRATTYPGMGDYALTFSAAVALPGLSLQPGTYEFHSPARHVVQVTSADGRLNSMFSTISTVRAEATAHYSIVLGAPAGPELPRRILAIFGPGELTGEEFVYPSR